MFFRVSIFFKPNFFLINFNKVLKINMVGRKSQYLNVNFGNQIKKQTV